MSTATKPNTDTQTTLQNRSEETNLHAQAGPVVICGMCGAQEKLLDNNTTECPYCDEYIY